MNTGAEAVETASRSPRKWGYEVKGVPADRAEIIVAAGNFHGRTTTIVGFSDRPGGPGRLRPVHARASAPSRTATPTALEAAIDETTVAVLLEPIQGEAGRDRPAGGLPAERARSSATEHDVLLIADEIQSGLGRTGRTFACELRGVVPGPYVLGKALGGGIVPVSAVVGRPTTCSASSARASTARRSAATRWPAAIGSAVVRLLETGESQARAAALGEPCGPASRRSSGKAWSACAAVGLWAGVDIDPDLATGREVCEALMARGVLAKDTHGSTIRLAPPLVITSDELEWAVDRLELALDDLAARRG